MIGIFLDIESNGLDSRKHRTLEIALKLVDLPTQQVLATYERLVFQPESIWKESDPNSLIVNGFNYDTVLKGSPEESVSSEIQILFKEFEIHRKHAVYICQNPSFDRTFFSQLVSPQIQEKNLWPYHWLDLASMFWALKLKEHQLKGTPPPWELGISKNKIAKSMGLSEESSPHRAMQGVDHLIDCYFKLHASH